MASSPKTIPCHSLSYKSCAWVWCNLGKGVCVCGWEEEDDVVCLVARARCSWEHTVGYLCILLDTLAYCWILLHTVGYSCILLDTLAYCWILLHTLAYCWILLHTVGYSCILLDTLAYCWILLHTVGYSCILLDTLAYCWILLHNASNKEF